MKNDFLTQIGHLGFTARMKRLNEKIVSSTIDHYSRLGLDIDPNWHVIFLLLKEKEKLSVTEIATTLGFSHPAIIKITRKMKERGYLETFKDEKDGRKTLIQISKKGKEILPTFEQEWFRIQEILEEFVGNDFLNKLDILENKFLKQSFHESYASHFAKKGFIIRKAKSSEFKEIGELMVRGYSSLEGFPKADAMPEYYNTLANIGEFTKKPKTELLIAVSTTDKILGGVLFFNDMKYYGTKGIVTSQKNAAGFRLLAVDPKARGMGVGRALTVACIEKAKKEGQNQIIIHSTAFMKVALKMYEKLGFQRSTDLDFKQGDIPVYGFRLKFKNEVSSK
ncbi:MULTISPECIES: bifunctional helix-turn-helix transcriptional regulator/GNAT family N-acetyltransferase [Flavobacteriaceae]|uniref:bifunctional helix-turn-helix transcriptional regulator/GNAT family N-acetyltransferase n=1 Tax=Flavobacteriaceae TaxID=49546 RepID=UPI0014920226|nr:MULTISPECIES: bifunctional helix-turn-helix transcriptional regulator/GNAT family N-acetyltransferase [Allomuricauda]MDC6365103.1 bifunctional helix-turn-helix transcriptional regulator/GNAT family N-acetyltransferase [Muricauda sp. AC10]